MDAPGSPLSRPQPQTVPFLILLAVVAAFAVLFYRVIQPLLLPLFLGAVVAMLVDPVEQWLLRKLSGRRHAAAGLLTITIVLVVIVPLSVAMYVAYRQLARAVVPVAQRLQAEQRIAILDPELNSHIKEIEDWLKERLPNHFDRVRETAIEVVSACGQALYRETVELAGDLATLTVGFAMFIVSLYFFLADGPSIMKSWEALTPMEAEHDRIMREEFTRVCRGVVWATLAAAVGQGILFGLGLTVIELFARVGFGMWIVLLALLTVGFAMVPLVGAAAIWAPVALFYFFKGHYIAGTAMILYGAGVISMVDNLIKIWVIRGSADLHPLLVFISVFGGIQLVGILGIFIGPIIGAVLFALLRILKQQLVDFGSRSPNIVRP